MRGISIRRPLIRTDGGEIRRGELYLDLMLRYPQRVHARSTRPRKQRSGCRCGCPLRVKSCYDRFAPEAVIRSLSSECPLYPQSGHSAAPKRKRRHDARRSGYTQMLSVTLGRSERTGAARWQQILFQLDGNDMLLWSCLRFSVSGCASQ